MMMMILRGLYVIGFLHCCFVNGRRIKPDEIFDLPGFLEKVLNTEAERNKYPPIGSINSRPAVGSLSGKDCSDYANWCSGYKTYCQYEQVHKYCPVTCNKCPTPTTPPPTPKQEKCIDLHSRCAYAKDIGYCTGSTAHRNFMERYCRKTCGLCTPCIDAYGEKYCEEQQQKGYCRQSTYKNFFKKNCAKTCGYCNEENGQKCGKAKLRLASDKKVDVVNGRNAQKGFYPWQTALYFDNEFICGATLINNKYILTAAHCFNGRDKDVRKYKVVLGDHNRGHPEGTEETYYIEKLTIHQGYKMGYDDHDIALMKLVPDVEFTDLIQPACMPSQGSTLPAGTKCMLSGWGKITFNGEAVDILQELQVPVVSNAKCKLRNAFNLHEVTNKMVCSGYNNGFDFSSGCHGDSGGPLSCERSPGIWTVEGVVSWGSPLCNGLDRYTVYTRVSSYKDWIDQNSRE